MMLTSEGQRGDAKRCRELGVAGYLMKPVAQAELLEALLSVHGNQTQLSTPLVTRHSLRESRRILNLLLAEDNAVNQTLAIRLLEKLGHVVTVANNGLEAVECWKNNHFDAILMDVDMPVMNGYEATEMIRKLEQDGSGHIIIIAMTAHAMQGIREECKQHGMDGYVSKPIDIEALWQELDIVAGDLVELDTYMADDLSQLMTVDFPKMRLMMDDNRDLFDEIVKLFVVDAPMHMQQIKDALLQGDVDAMRHAAHTLKGMFGVFAAEKAMKAAETIEMEVGKIDMKPAVEQLDFAFNELLIAIEEYQW